MVDRAADATTKRGKQKELFPAMQAVTATNPNRFAAPSYERPRHGHAGTVATGDCSKDVCMMAKLEGWSRKCFGVKMEATA
jgi:hypothetical protein